MVLDGLRAEEQADESSPAYLPGFFQSALGALIDSPRITAAAKTGEGVGWHEHSQDVFDGAGRFFGTNYSAHLVAEWLPALDGVVDKLQRGASVADVGCGQGVSTILMAQAFPAATFVGSDYHEGSITTARQHAAKAGVSDRVRFEIAPASAFSGAGYDLVTTFDSLHDMGDPVGAARHVRQSLAADGTWMIVEPMAGDRVEDNFNPLGRAFYGFSTLLCTPASLSQEVGLALGAQAGEARIRDVITTAGLTRFRRASETPVNAEDGPAQDSPGEYPDDQWRQLAEHCLRDRRTVILEGSFLQNSVMPAFIDGAPARAVTEIFTRITRQAAPAEPLLVYLRPADIGAAIARVHRDRGEPWSSANQAFVENTPWARRRGLRGQDAVVRLYQAWEPVVTRLYNSYPFPKVMVTDPQHDWQATLARIRAAVRPEQCGTPRGPDPLRPPADIP